MPDRLPPSAPVLIIGAGVHGLSTAWHLGLRGRSTVVGPVDVDSGAVTALFPRPQMGSPAGDPD